MKYRLVNENFKNDYGKNLLRARGITDINSFLHPDSKTCLCDYKLLDNIEAGVDALAKALDEDKPILIIVDSDVDGYTSAAIIYLYIKYLDPDANLHYRLHSGKQHGLEDHIDDVADEDWGLIICPDSSSNDKEYHERLNCPVLILDHHELDCEVSPNAIIINNQTSKYYPNKELTGAGVTYQFCRAVDELCSVEYEKGADNYLDLAALGVCADMGSVTTLENRLICYMGFRNIKNLFFQTIVEKQSYSMGGKVNPITVAFYVVPMINAMIRTGTMEEKIRLFEAFIHGDELIPSGKKGAKGTLEARAVESVRECANARNRQNKILDSNVDKFEDRIYKYGLLDNKVLFVRLEDEDKLPSELNGLLAMKLAAKYKRPTIVARLNPEGFDRGSIRNVDNCALSDLKAFLTNSGYFEYVQGHANAAGCSIADKNLRDFHAYANEKLADLDFGEDVFDVNLVRAAADKDIADIVFDLANYEDVWGHGNDQPFIYVHDLNVTKDDYQIMGKNKDTLKITKFGVAYMKFFAKDLIHQLETMGKIKINLIGKPNLNEWAGRYTPQIFIEAYEVQDDTLGF